MRDAGGTRAFDIRSDTRHPASGTATADISITFLTGLDDKVTEAAALACAATPATAFWRLNLTDILPAMDSGIALLIAGPKQSTLPREMFSGLRDGITPALTAVATGMTTLQVVVR